MRCEFGRVERVFPLETLVVVAAPGRRRPLPRLGLDEALPRRPVGQVDPGLGDSRRGCKYPVAGLGTARPGPGRRLGRDGGMAGEPRQTASPGGLVACVLPHLLKRQDDVVYRGYSDDHEQREPMPSLLTYRRGRLCCISLLKTTPWQAVLRLNTNPQPAGTTCGIFITSIPFNSSL